MMHGSRATISINAKHALRAADNVSTDLSTKRRERIRGAQSFSLSPSKERNLERGGYFQIATDPLRRSDLAITSRAQDRRPRETMNIVFAERYSSTESKKRRGASGRETVTSATGISRTASTATPTLQCDVAIPTDNSPCDRDGRGVGETDFRGTLLRSAPQAARHAIASSDATKPGTPRVHRHHRQRPPLEPRDHHHPFDAAIHSTELDRDASTSSDDALRSIICY